MECKYTYVEDIIFFQFELIDTLWNVNEQNAFVRDLISRINRYIMECKYVQDKLIALHHLELIDTLWNVNIAKFVMIVTPVAELIDTLWNVNFTISMLDWKEE